MTSTGWKIIPYDNLINKKKFSSIGIFAAEGHWVSNTKCFTKFRIHMDLDSLADYTTAVCML
jgi:hypothetical protein